MSTVDLGPERNAGWVDGGHEDEETPAVRLAAGVLGVVVRLWCLPLLLVVWVLGWAAIGTIRGVGTVATLCAGPSSPRAGQTDPAAGRRAEPRSSLVSSRASV